MLFAETWIDLEPRDCHTKPEKDKYHIISCICEILKKCTYLQSRNRLRHRKQSYDYQRERGMK